jgi:hypothetical protein
LIFRDHNAVALLHDCWAPPRGDSTTTTGILTETGAYTQHSNGVLDISMGGTMAGAKYDQLNRTTASLSGTLNIGLINGYVPTIGTMFKIVNFSSETGMFTTVNGLPINPSEHFTISYQGNDVLLTVVSGPLQQPVANGGLHYAASARPNLVGNPLGSATSNSRFSAAKLGITAAETPAGSGGSFQAVAARQQTTFGLRQSRATVATYCFAAVPTSNAPHATTSGMHFPTRIAASNSRSMGTTNGAYGLHNRAVGGGFVFPLSHLSKPRWASQWNNGAWMGCKAVSCTARVCTPS